MENIGLQLYTVRDLLTSDEQTDAPDTPSSDPVSSSGSDETSSVFLTGGEEIPFAPQKGYIQHTSIYAHQSEIVAMDGFECMGTDEFLLLRAGTTIAGNAKFAVFCYKVSDVDLVLDLDKANALGLSLSDMNTNMTMGPYTLTEDTIVRIAVKGILKTDVVITVPDTVTEEWIYEDTTYFMLNK